MHLTVGHEKLLLGRDASFDNSTRRQHQYSGALGVFAKFFIGNKTLQLYTRRVLSSFGHFQATVPCPIIEQLITL